MVGCNPEIDFSNHMEAFVNAVDGEFGLKFGKPKIVMTRVGEREVRNALVTEEFWTAWRADKAGIKGRGYGVSRKDDGAWEVSFWSATMSEAERAQAHAESKSADADLEIPVPAGCELMPFQKAGVAYAMKRTGTLIGDEMGLGKTVQAIGTVNATGAQRILVVAPASLLLNWRNEIKKWQIGDMLVHVVRPGFRFPQVERGWVVTNYDIVSRYEKDLKASEWDVVIFDECQYLKSRGSQRTLTLVGGRKRNAKTKQMETFDPVPAKRKLLLTGTPIMNRPEELFPLLHYLDAKRWGTWTGFAKRYCGASFNGFGYDTGGATNLDELQSRLRETVMVRRLKADVLKELPAKRRQVIVIDAEDDATQAIIKREVETFDRMESEIADAAYAMQTAEAEGDDAKYKAAVEKLRQVQGIAFTEIAKVRHETALAKLPAVIDRLRETDGKVIVFAHHLDVIRGLIEALKDEGVVSITGETPPEKRQDIVGVFQNDPNVRFFIGNIKAAGVGLTLTASSHVVFAELDWTPAAVSQAEDRAHRIGQRDNVLVQQIVLDGSLDARMAKILVEKQAIIDKALDNQAGPKVFDETPIIVPQEPVAAPKPEKPQPSLNADQIAAVHAALRTIAAFDSDRARQINGVGFSKMDTRFGCELAQRSSLTPRQAGAALKIVRKYRRQYSPDLYARIFGEALENA